MYDFLWWGSAPCHVTLATHNHSASVAHWLQVARIKAYSRCFLGAHCFLTSPSWLPKGFLLRSLTLDHTAQLPLILLGDLFVLGFWLFLWGVSRQGLSG